jgi:RHS repeat-associated protein
MPRLTRTVVPGCAHQIAQRWPKFDYEYAANTNNISEIAYVHRDSNTVDYTYDNLDRLTLAEYSIDDNNEAFTIDDLGNRDLVNVRDGSNVDYVIDANTNRYTEIGGSNPEYDAAGNLIEDYNGYEYEYDYENRITKITKSGATKAEFIYDALGRRIYKYDQVADEPTFYYYNDKWQVLCEYDFSALQRWYAYGNYIDEVLVMGESWSEESDDIYYYAHDHLYSPVVLVRRNEFVLKERYEYDAYGNCTILSPTYDIRDTSDYSNPYYFTGRELDTLDNGDLKIMNYRHRYYDTYAGRFTTHDPLGYVDGMNLYEYGKTNPVLLTDPMGLCFLPPPICPRPFPLPGDDDFGSPAPPLAERETKHAMYLFARTVIIRDEHWRDLLKAWYYESNGNEVTYEGFGHQTVKDIADNAGFQRLLSCWVAKYSGCFEEIPEEGKHFRLEKKSFWWHYYFPDPTVPGGLAAYTDATDFLGSYTAFVEAKKSKTHKCHVDMQVTVKNLTNWPSACKTLKFFKESWPGKFLPDYPSHGQGAGPYSPSRGGDFRQEFIFKVNKVPVMPATFGDLRACMNLR